jgi:hypothetical protein
VILHQFVLMRQALPVRLAATTSLVEPKGRGPYVAAHPGDLIAPPLKQ